MDHSLSQYKIFYTVALYKNISRAAQELYISQPTISKSIRRLEDTLGVPLFFRNSRGVRLTEEGQVLFEYVQKAFEALDLGEEKLKNFQSLGMGHLRIGASTTLSKYLLLPALRKFVKDYPHIRISIQCQSSAYTQKLLEEGKIDVGLMGVPSGDFPLDFHPFGNVQDIFVASPLYLENLCLRENTSQTVSSFFSCGTLMLLDHTNLSRQHIEQYLTRHQLHAGNLLEITTMDLLIEFAKIGLGIACVIKEFVADELKQGTLKELPMPSPVPKRQIGLSYGNLPRALTPSKFLSYFSISS